MPCPHPTCVDRIYRAVRARRRDIFINEPRTRYHDNGGLCHLCNTPFTSDKFPRIRPALVREIKASNVASFGATSLWETERRERFVRAAVGENQTELTIFNRNQGRHLTDHQSQTLCYSASEEDAGGREILRTHKISHAQQPTDLTKARLAQSYPELESLPTAETKMILYTESIIKAKFKNPVFINLTHEGDGHGRPVYSTNYYNWANAEAPLIEVGEAYIKISLNTANTDARAHPYYFFRTSETLKASL